MTAGDQNAVSRKSLRNCANEGVAFVKVTPGTASTTLFSLVVAVFPLDSKMRLWSMVNVSVVCVGWKAPDAALEVTLAIDRIAGAYVHNEKPVSTAFHDAPKLRGAMRPM